MPSPSKKVLFVSLSGIGNFLMQSPTWQQLKGRHPEWEITVWIAPRGTKALAEADPAITAVIEAPIQTSPAQHLRTVSRLRAEKCDVGIVLSPGQLIKSAVYLYTAGIPRRIGQTYRFAGNPHSKFLLTDALTPKRGEHDIEQNLNLATVIDPDITPSSPAYSLSVPSPHQTQAARILADLNLLSGTTVVGLHAGSAPNFEWKRWPLENFAAVARNLIEKNNAHILIFGGPDEQGLKEKVRTAIRNPARTSLIETDLLATAALMQRCRLVIANDSGLMHVSAAAGATTLGLFGPTNEARIGPRGKRSFTLRAPDTQSVYDVNTNFDLGSEPHSTLSALTPELVLKKINEILQ